MQNTLWQQLSSAGLVGEQPTNQPQPLWLTLLTGFAGWFAALFFLAFSIALIESIGRFDESQALIIGVVYALIARFIYAQAGKVEFLQQFGFAINIAAMIAIVWGLGELWDGSTLGFYLCGFAVLVVNAWFARYSADAMLSLIAAVTLAGVAFEDEGVLSWFVPPVLLTLALVSGVWQTKRPWQLAIHPFARRWQHALFLCLLILPLLLDARLTFWSPGLFDTSAAFSGDLYLISVTMTLYLLFVAALLHRIWAYWGVTLLGTVALTILYWYFPGLALSLGCWLLGWQLNERYYVLTTLVAAIGYFSAYYYEMYVSLLMKSVVLMLLGILLLGVGFYCKKRAAI